MRLTGSRKEETMRDQLVASNLALRNGDEPMLSDALRSVGVDVAHAYVTGHTPDQGEDYYAVLAPDDVLLHVEVSRLTGEFTVESCDAARLRSTGSKRDRIAYLIVRELWARYARSAST